MAIVNVDGILEGKRTDRHPGDSNPRVAASLSNANSPGRGADRPVAIAASAPLT
jgi:hypothetical protein